MKQYWIAQYGQTQKLGHMHLLLKPYHLSAQLRNVEWNDITIFTVGLQHNEIVGNDYFSGKQLLWKVKNDRLNIFQLGNYDLVNTGFLFLCVRQMGLISYGYIKWTFWAILSSTGDKKSKWL